MAKSRSRAGSICQTRVPDLVVSGLASGVLLSSMFPFLDLTLFYVVFDWFDLLDSGLKQRGFGQKSVNIAKGVTETAKSVNNGKKTAIMAETDK